MKTKIKKPLIFVMALLPIAVICEFLGCILAEMVGLMRPIRFKKDAWFRACLLGVISGLVFSLDYWIFGKIIPEVAASCNFSYL